MNVPEIQLSTTRHKESKQVNLYQRNFSSTRKAFAHIPFEQGKQRGKNALKCQSPFVKLLKAKQIPPFQ